MGSDTKYVYDFAEGNKDLKELLGGKGANLAEMTAKIRKHTDLPIAVGFGISNPDQARLVAQNADAVVVGSAVVNQIAQHGKSPELVKRVSNFVSALAKAVEQDN